MDHDASLLCRPADAPRFLASAHEVELTDRKSTRLNSSHSSISYAVFCLKKKNLPPADAALHQPHSPPLAYAGPPGARRAGLRGGGGPDVRLRVRHLVYSSGPHDVRGAGR